ncbi:M20 metallopeptidase family protein [Desulfogranum mediterraneum]|uniref:M20 metallopeptidase family protein n=1 Tax=Desulfogranum mediterraneum TaxID=160661 RepID=UPI00040E9DB7|nr:M20 family metallopeptidase [Desulfogranum mediterraneum]
MKLQTVQGTPLSPYLVEIRRRLHRHPELAFREEKTAALVRRELDRLQIPHRPLAGTGIRAELHGRQAPAEPGAGRPCLALRADMDGLPIQEQTGLSFASEHPGLMHACGHDGHTAMLLGAAHLLWARDFSGKVVLLFQPAEEAGNGAGRMVEEGGLDQVELIFAGHIDTHIPTRTFTVDSGLICSSADPFAIRIRGRGAHASRPHEAIDAVVLASTLVVQIQTLVSRAINPSHAAVVTVGRLRAGTVLNAIAEEALLEGTIRSAHPQARTALRQGLERLIQGVEAMGCAGIELEYLPGLPAVINDERAAAIARSAALRLVGREGVRRQEAPSLGSEDFALYQQEVPGCLVRFGARLSGDPAGPAHSGRYDFDEQVLEQGAAWLAQVARQGLLHLEGSTERR